MRSSEPREVLAVCRAKGSRKVKHHVYGKREIAPREQVSSSFAVHYFYT